MKNGHLSHEEFIRIWQTSQSVAEVAQHARMSEAKCKTRRGYLKTMGIILKRMRRRDNGRKKIDRAALQKLASDLLKDQPNAD